MAIDCRISPQSIVAVFLLDLSYTNCLFVTRIFSHLHLRTGVHVLNATSAHWCTRVECHRKLHVATWISLRTTSVTERWELRLHAVVKVMSKHVEALSYVLSEVTPTLLQQSRYSMLLSSDRPSLASYDRLRQIDVGIQCPTTLTTLAFMLARTVQYLEGTDRKPYSKVGARTG